MSCNAKCIKCISKEPGCFIVYFVLCMIGWFAGFSLFIIGLISSTKPTIPPNLVIGLIVTSVIVGVSIVSCIIFAIIRRNISDPPPPVNPPIVISKLPVDQLVDQRVDQPVDQLGDQRVDVPVDQPINYYQYGDVPVDQRADVPVELEPDTECLICADAKKDVVFVPCGHTACTKCAKSLKQCHMCRQPINIRQKIFG